MTECDICKIIGNKDSFKVIYEDDICFAMLHEAPGNIGHALVIPKEHHTIFEEVPDPLAERCFLVANQISVAVFESLGAHGTNILVNNGPSAGQEQPHFMINVIPRYENDGLNLDWEMKQAKKEDLDMNKDLISKSVDKIFFGGNTSLPSESKIEKIDDEENDSLMVKHLKRMP